MIPELREKFNKVFDEQTYDAFKYSIEKKYNHLPVFRIAETPIFIPRELKDKIMEAAEDILEVILAPDFMKNSTNAIPPALKVPQESNFTHFLQMDFGVCIDEKGELTPQLIEAQGFPSLYFFQDLLANKYREYFDIPDHYTHLFNGLDSESYKQKLRNIIIGDADPETTILLEVEPDKQATAIDFYATREALGIDTVCVTDLKVEGKDVYYYKDNRKIKVKRIYNRVIFDELVQRTDLRREFRFNMGANVEWIGHPNWFFRLSKHTLPFLKSQYVPESHFLNELENIPPDLENYVLKPLFSFAGSGVIINVKRSDLDSVSNPENYILQRKVTYAPVIKTPNISSKCEIRVMFLWEKHEERPLLVNNLVRLSKGEMVGVKYNKDKDWVGGSVGFFER
ncbi:MAG: hypothetical protein KDC85_18115 [Saprospiraceae bacterium]|nr:hypothetical protein [Saprospiraceae bacterium]MCB9326489.1 hypothetical protein [Lewinellaceae bacterium]